MALPYPEGEVFFMRSALRSKLQMPSLRKEGTTWKVDMVNFSKYQAGMKDFYSHFMVEYIWNRPADHASEAANTAGGGHRHPRSPYTIVRGGGGWRTDYGNWTQLPFSYGPSEDNIKRRVQHNLCTDGKLFKQRERGAADESWFMTMPMPTKEEKWVWIDMLAHIRAIYIPLAWVSSEDHPHLSTWLQVNFTSGKEIPIWRGGESFMAHPTDRTAGLGVWRDATVGFDITGLIHLLSVPRQFRKYNPYTAKFIKIVGRDSIKTVPLGDSYSDFSDYSWLDITKMQTGMNIEYVPGNQSNWFEDFFKNALEFGLGFIPGVGPLLSIFSSLAWTAIREPDKLLGQLTLWMPTLKLAHDELEDMKKSSIEMRRLTQERFWKAEERQAQALLLNSTLSMKMQKASGDTISYFKDTSRVLNCGKAKYDKELAGEEAGTVVATFGAQ
ncbi:hypothetical protein NW768_010169 [Fusarium equiseti]|uniref:Uncharacterized protein n=1 Tax=Fusarium equiseti TaxID=61235 RepID=A0ABQ8R126_FUSEQ|nr:hypothetical protein NW768_010169 [Fusarium equiseti]